MNAQQFIFALFALFVAWFWLVPIAFKLIRPRVTIWTAPILFLWPVPILIVMLIVAAQADPLPFCRSPNVPRIVQGLVPVRIGGKLVIRVLHYRLECPQAGICFGVAEVEAPERQVVCLSPAEHEAALKAGERE